MTELFQKALLWVIALVQEMKLEARKIVAEGRSALGHPEYQTKPSRKGPWIALLVSFYIFCSGLLTVMQGSPNAVGALEAMAICAVIFTGSCLWMKRRLNAIGHWKEQRFWAWIMKDLPELEPPATTRHIGEDENDQRE